MTYYNEKILARTRAHAFVPETSSPINAQPQYSYDALEDGPLIAGGPMGAYFAQVPAQRSAGVLWREQTVPGLGALVASSPSVQYYSEGLGLSLPSIPSVPGLDINAIVGPIIGSLEPTMESVFSRYMPRVESAVSGAVKNGINQGINQAWPTVEKKIEPYKNAAIAFGLVSVATLAGVMVLLAKKGK